MSFPAAAVHHFTAPTRIVAGLDSVALLPAELTRLGTTPLALICDRGVADAGLLAELTAPVETPRLVSCGLVDPDPSVDDAEESAARASQAGCGGVLVIGGGSALGLGKAVAIRLRNERPIGSYHGVDQLDVPPAPCLAIPTTAGSGGEVSGALVLYDHGKKVVVRGPGYAPTTAILDGNLLKTLPRQPFLDAALDALSHALEALWAHRASQFTDALALAAARTIRTVLPRALAECEPADLQTLLEASAIANLACGSARMGLVHALSSAPGISLSHGYQNGVLLFHVARYNQPVLGAAAAAEIEALPALYDALGCEPRFRPGEVDDDGVERMVRVTLDDPYGEEFLQNNKREAGEPELRELLAAAGAGSRMTTGRKA